MKLTGVTTLIVDDDRYGDRILMLILRGFGLATPVIVDTGAAAQALLESQCYDLFICEAALPDISGADLVRWIRRLKTPARFMPILVLTGYSNTKNVVELRDSGAHLVVKK